MFKDTILPLVSFASRYNPEFESSVTLVNSQLVCLLKLGFLTMLRLFEIFVSFISDACL